VKQVFNAFERYVYRLVDVTIKRMGNNVYLLETRRGNLAQLLMSCIHCYLVNLHLF
jgi:hypothetical protein